MTKTENTEFRMGSHAFSSVWPASFGIVTGVVLDAIVVATYGMGKQTDAYYIASTIPMAIISLFGLFGTRVVLPIFIRKRSTEGDAAGWKYLNLIVSSGFGIVSLLSVVGMLSSEMLMRVQSGGAARDDVRTATQLSMFFFSILPLCLPMMVMKAALNSCGKFVLPAAAKFFENTFKIFFVLLLWRTLGVHALVWGMLAGVVCQIVVFFIVLEREGYRFQPILRPNHPDMIQAYRLVGFQLGGNLVGASVDVFSNRFGSMLGPGVVTALKLATRIIESVGGLLQGGVVTAAIPAIASSVAQEDREGTKKYTRRGLYLLLMVSVPLAVWLVLLNRELVAFLYQRGSFSRADTNLVSGLLLAMVPYYLFGRFRSLFELPFFAEQNAGTPLLASVTEAAIYVGGSALGVSYFGPYALPMARAMGGVVGSWLLGYWLKRRIGKLSMAAVVTSSGRLWIAAFIMAGGILIGDWLSAAIPLQGFSAKVIGLALPSSGGFMAFGISLVALGIMDLSLLDGFGMIPRRWLSGFGIAGKRSN